MQGPLKPQHNREQRHLRLPPLDVDSCASYSQYSVHRIDDQSYSEYPPKPHIVSASASDVTGIDGDLDDVLLRAIEPPDHSKLSLNDTLRQVKLTTRRKHCFKQLLVRVGMSVWSLHFKPEYERHYCTYLYEHAIARIRYAISIAFLFLLLKSTYETSNMAAVSQFKAEWKIVLQLHVFVALPLLFGVLVSTHIRRMDRYCEYYGALPFLVVASVLTVQKILLQTKGPIFAMFLVFVPVFGITRFRLSTSVALVALMFSGHVLGLLLFQQAETTTDVLFQAYNYFGGIVVGVVYHYRAEVLRRRNYVMLLPFADEPLDQEAMYQKLHDPRLKKHTLMNRSTLKFNNATVDEAFYRHWYLIDPCPFDHPNAGELHRTVYRSIRFAVGGVIFTQLMLVVQDWEYLYSDRSFPHAAYIVATCLRFTIVIPAYGIAPFIMLFCGTRFYWQWRKQAANQDRGGLRSPCRSARNVHALESSNFSSAYSEPGELATTAYVTIRTPVNEAVVRNITTLVDETVKQAPPFRNNYVRALQWLSTAIVFCHALAMGIILLLVDQLANQHKASAAPCYFLGFLNALLFPHRSGFRVRFVYATSGTVCVSAIFIAVAIAVGSAKVWTYASYIALTNILGMMVSHEEESLRRIFFVRMMLRSDEFRRRHDAILTMEPWFKDRIRKRRRAKSAKAQQEPGDEEGQGRAQNAEWSMSSGGGSPSIMRIPTVNQMSQAGKVGMSLEMTRAAIALLTELTTAVG